MQTYRLNTALSAILQDEAGMRIVSLAAGTIVYTPTVAPEPPGPGLVNVTVDRKLVSVFMEDLETRSDLIEESGLASAQRNS